MVFYNNFIENYEDIKSIPETSISYSIKKERQFLKIFLLERLHNLFYQLFNHEIKHYKNKSLMEGYNMDNQILRLLINAIIESGEYNLEGISYYTRIPLDVIFDAACGNNRQFSITSWTRIIRLFFQVKPDVAHLFFEKLFEMKNKNYSNLLSLLNEP